tara:strand:- start:218 stop:640 length:423 start_codon:yes stop_codon:yes gene_type:complete
MPKVILPEIEEEELDAKKSDKKAEEGAEEPAVVIEKETITAEAPEEPAAEEPPSEEEPPGEATPEDVAGKILSEGPRTAEDVLKLIEDAGYELSPTGKAADEPAMPPGPPSLGPLGILGPPNRMATLRLDAVKKAMHGGK